MSDSGDIFEFLNDLYDDLPDLDKLRFGEYWKALEQTYGDVWMRLFQSNRSVNVNKVALYNNHRWLKYTFDHTTQVDMAAQYRTNQDLSLGINLSTRYLVKIGVDGGTPIEIDLRGANALNTKIFEIVTKINTVFGFTFATAVVGNALINFMSATTGPTSSITFYPVSNALADATPIVIGLSATQLPYTTPQFPYSFQLGDPTVVGIPVLQDKIHLELSTSILNEDIDYTILFGTGIISFLVAPPTTMWGKDNLLNLETPYKNFGFLMNFYDVNTPAYLKAVRGLWFAYWNGPTPENIRRSLYLLLGLPVASNNGTVTAITDTTITLTYTNSLTETFTIPVDLTPIVTLGQSVVTFQPLVNGVVVLDKINTPGFIASQVGRAGIQQFLTQFATRGTGPNTDETKALTLLEQNTYLPQIDVNAFISPNIKISNIKTFLANIQPKSRTALFQILIGNFQDPILTNEALELDISFDVTPNVDYNPNTFAQQSDLTDAETNPNTGITLDEGTAVTDTVHIDVYNNAILTDSFDLEG